MENKQKDITSMSAEELRKSLIEARERADRAEMLNDEIRKQLEESQYSTSNLFEEVARLTEENKEVATAKADVEYYKTLYTAVSKERDSVKEKYEVLAAMVGNAAQFIKLV